MSRKVLTTMRSFAGGQLNNGARRRDDIDAYKTGARVMSDWRIEETETLVPRPGRRLLANVGTAARIEYVRLASVDYAIGFGFGADGGAQVVIFNLATAATVAVNESAGYAWTPSTLALIYMTVADNQIVICYPGMQPQVIFYAPTAATFAFAPFAFRTIASQIQQPFYRSGNPGATMSYGYVLNGCALTCSQPYFTPAMVGNTLSILGQQVTITGVSSPTTATCSIASRLPDVVVVTVANGAVFAPQQIVEDSGAAFKMEVFSVSGNVVTGVLTSAIIYPGNLPSGDNLVSPLGSSAIQGTPTTAVAGTTLQWQEQFMGATSGWPTACAYDKARLIFFGFPQKPGAILWSAVDAYDTFWIDSGAATLQPDAGTNANDAILEFIPDGPQVRHVVGSGDEFVFTDRGVFYVPISGTNPLKPGSVEFRRFSSDGVATIKPVETNNSIIYINAGGKRATVIRRTQGYNDPYETADPADLHTDLFTGPVVLAVAQGDGIVPERLIYVLNADGSIIHGKFSRDGKLIGWLPWYSAQPPSWLFSSISTIYYCVPLAGASWLAEDDTTLYLDSVITPNALPATFPPVPAGAGPLFALQGQTVTCMLGTLDLGERSIDSNGNLILLPDDPASGNFGNAALLVGFIFTPKLQPFVPASAPGESVGQRQHKRSITRALVSVELSSGFTIGSREVPPYHQGDDATQPPPLYDENASVRPLGRSFDPGCLLMKPRPGPLRVIEYSTEATV